MKPPEAMKTPHEIAEFHHKRADTAAAGLFLTIAGAILFPIVWGGVAVTAFETGRQVWLGSKAHLEKRKEPTSKP